MEGVETFSFDSMTNLDVQMQVISEIDDIGQEWCKLGWFNSKCARFGNLETHI